MSRTLLAFAAGIALLAGAGCARSVDLEKSLAITDVFTGWYDNGIKDGLNQLVPSISFRLQNVGSTPVSEVELIVSFWQDGADGELTSKDVNGIGSSAIAPGASTDPILVHGDVGYTLEAPRAELFNHSQFKDFTAKVFAKRGGKIVRLGEHKLDRRILPHLLSDARP